MGAYGSYKHHLRINNKNNSYATTIVQHFPLYTILPLIFEPIYAFCLVHKAKHVFFTSSIKSVRDVD